MQDVGGGGGRWWEPGRAGLEQAGGREFGLSREGWWRFLAKCRLSEEHQTVPWGFL